MPTLSKSGRNILVILYVILLQVSCAGQGSRSQKEVAFSKSVRTEVILGLHIVPVELHGKKYRFLFDTGAPTSISKAVQNELRYKVIDRGHIVDSDKNKIRVNYVRVDSIVIEDIKFRNVKAFVADFTANPTLACLELDGILGSNMMQACNWQIDYTTEQIAFSNEPFLIDERGVHTAEFRADDQYNLMVDLKMGRAKVSNMKIDYGNNSSITVPHKVFQFLVDEKILNEHFLEEGYNQGGIGANPVAMKRYYGYLDTLKIGDLMATDLTLKTGKSGLIGRDFLSRYIVAINWSEKKLRFKPHASWEDSRPTFGYSIGLHSSGHPILFGVAEGSSAAKNKLKTGMRVIRVDSIDFTRGATYCDYINYFELPHDELVMTLKNQDGKDFEVTLIKTLLDNKN
jgi:hypothetical protein